jgi:hypothetical protein
MVMASFFFSLVIAEVLTARAIHWQNDEATTTKW